ncbi:MAG: glycosyl transferase [Oscillospiraceae bacterium]|nr:glycosyl transferase [Oscillospiraceae bacterium]
MSSASETSQAKKHAYLIMCHNQFDLLCMLLSAIDDYRNDIYLHIDKKAKDVPLEKIRNTICKGKLVLIERISVNWGGYSQIKAELCLLEEATKEEHEYYHLLSGADFPLKSQEEIHSFFAANRGKQFIAFDSHEKVGDEVKDRLRYYYRYQDRLGRSNDKSLLSRLQAISLRVQKLAGIDRLSQCPYEIWKGANWFSITHDLANYVLAEKETIKECFADSLCADELVLQSVAYSSPFHNEIAYCNMRYIDWKRGNPYTFTIEDYDELTACGKLFARKFSENDLDLVKKIFRDISPERVVPS